VDFELNILDWSLTRAVWTLGAGTKTRAGWTIRVTAGVELSVNPNLCAILPIRANLTKRAWNAFMLL
jgi:hypothetical protein